VAACQIQPQEVVMRVVVAGATGVIGRCLVPRLSAAGHEVTGLSRAEGVDLLDRDAVGRAVGEADPDAVVHIATAIPARINPKAMTRDMELTNRLRTDGTRNLIDAAQAAGAKRIIVQGLAYPYQPGEGLADEDTPLWRDPPRDFASSMTALLELERLTAGAGGLVLRFGHLYGPGSAYAADGSFTAQVRARQVPVVGSGGSVFSFIHARDAAAAVVAALDHEVSGVLNIVDDTPAPIGEWLPAFAAMLGAPAPRHVPPFLARLAGGGWGAAFMTRLRGVSNARARAQLAWRPRYPVWSEGLRAGLDGDGASR
jgi:nucleoside-diphosphate-sugar epimerase